MRIFPDASPQDILNTRLSCECEISGSFADRSVELVKTQVISIVTEHLGGCLQKGVSLDIQFFIDEPRFCVPG